MLGESDPGPSVAVSATIDLVRLAGGQECLKVSSYESFITSRRTDIVGDMDKLMTKEEIQDATGNPPKPVRAPFYLPEEVMNIVAAQADQLEARDASLP